jgi:Domain of unknown function (DUF4112)
MGPGVAAMPGPSTFSLPSSVRPPSPSSLEALRRWAVILDSYFRVPGTNIRFGFDALIGLIPGAGDLVAPVFTIAVLATGFKMRVPAVVQARMVLNALIDMLFGLVPLLGDLVDIAWKADLRNVALLERHAQPGVPPTRSDYVFVLICVGIVVGAAVLPILFLLWLLSRFSAV